MSWAGAMRVALLSTLGRGRWWALALAAFLVRGGVLVLLPAVVIPPTPAQLALIVLDPSITGAGVGILGPALVGILALVATATGLLVVGTGLVGAWMDADLIPGMAAEPGLAGAGRRLAVPLWRSLAVRLVAHVPTLVAGGGGLVILAAATYAELVSPSGPGSIVGRVVLRAPVAVAAMIATWLVGEAWGGLAVRRLGRGDSILAALGGSVRLLVRPSGLATLIATTLAVGAAVLATALVVGGAFDRLWPLVVAGADPGAVGAALVAFVAAWGAGLSLLALVLAWRSAAWTVESLRSG